MRCFVARARFGRDCRLTRGDAFREAFDQSEGRRARTFVLWVRRAPDASRRLGVVASKRTFRHAVDRNRARRLLRESFRLHRHLLADGVDLVLVARHRILEGGRTEVDRDLLAALRKEKLLNGEGNAQCTMHNAQCSMRNAQCRMQNAEGASGKAEGERETGKDE